MTPKPIHPPEMTSYSDAVMTATPDKFVRPTSVSEIQEIVRGCNTSGIPLTCCGSRTSMTGSSVTDAGVLMSLDTMTGITSIDTTNKTVTVLPGTILGEMQKAVEAQGLFYPPSPTSRNECTVGATIITNATGDTTFKYGSTRPYVKEVKVVMADGTLRTITRKNPAPMEFKNKAGYFLGGEEIDLLIGSEGTLAIIVEATLSLLPKIPHLMTFMIPFPSNMDALHFIADYKKFSGISPRTMEYIDESAAAIMRTHPSFAQFPENARAFVICQQEYHDAEEDTLMESWCAALPNEDAIVARTDAEQQKIADWRHHIPSVVSERHLELQKLGGGKVGTDWWVPLPQMLDTMKWVYAESDKLNIPYIAFGHLGNGHPHVNYLTRNADERTRAKAFVMDCCRRAVSLSGGVAGEHGIGKLKRDLLTIQHPQSIIDQMIAIKKIWDPKWILGRGNIFNSPSI